MVDILLLQTISVLVASAGLLIAALYYIFQLRHLRRQREIEIETRQAQLFMQLYNHYQGEEVQRSENEVILQWKWKDLEDFWEKYGPETNMEAFTRWDAMETYFKGVGVLMRRKLIDPNLVYDLIGPAIIIHWEKFGPIIVDLRKRYWSHAFEGYEQLYDEMKKREQQLASKAA